MDGARVDMKVVAATWALLASSLVACSATSGGTAGAAEGDEASTSTTPDTSTSMSDPGDEDGDGETSAGDTSAPGDGDGDSTGTSTSGDGDGDADGDAEEPAPVITQAFTPSDALFPNPERGIYRYRTITETEDLSWIPAEDRSLVFSYIRLDDYRTAPLPQSLLDAVHDGLEVVRAAGVKVVLRFSYNFGPYPNSEPDAPLSFVLTHIDQLEPILQANGDVIAVVQAGFIGAWGEWHSSTNDLLPDKQQILSALLDAIPSDRMTQIRYPYYKEELFGAPLDLSTGLSGSQAARTGHHNDCFLASDTDFGTYPSAEIEAWKEYLEQDVPYVPVGGETCNPNPPRSDCPTALEELERFHYSFLNLDYHPDVIDGWVAQGCFEEIERRLGYRLQLDEVDLAPIARPGGHFDFRARLQNVGWAAPFNPRGATLVLEGPSGRFETELLADVRAWRPGVQPDIAGRLDLPSELTPGDYVLGMWLPDAHQNLRDRSAYAIRLASEGVWRAADALNILGTITIADDAPGTFVPGQSFKFTPDL